MEASFDYRLKTQPVQLGDERFEIRCLESLDLTIDELFEHLKRGGREELLEELCPYFGVVWPAAFGLALRLRDERAALPGKRVLELGCGLALPSLAAIRFGAEVLATDLHPAVPEFLARNLALNGIPALRYERLDWKAEDIGARLGFFDLVIGSDILYERRHLAEVPRALLSCLAPGGRAMIADPGRPYLQAFVDEMERAGFRSLTEIRSVPVADPDRGAKTREVFVIEFALSA